MVTLLRNLNRFKTPIYIFTLSLESLKGSTVVLILAMGQVWSQRLEHLPSQLGFRSASDRWRFLVPINHIKKQRCHSIAPFYII